MTNEVERLFDRFNQFAVGFGPIFRDADFSFTNRNYPPHNVVTVSDNEFYIELAVAGFKKEEISIQDDNGLLTISSNKVENTDKPNFQYRGIAERSFTKSFRIAEYFEIKDATLENGMLTVSFIKNAPVVTPKLITIK